MPFQSIKNEKTYPWLRSYPEGVQWDAEIPPAPLYSLIDHAREHYADRPGFDFLGNKLTWGELAELSNKMAKGLQDMGVKKGDRVGLFLPNTPYYLIAYFAIARAGGTVVNLNPLYAERELTHLIEDSEIDIVVTVDLKLTYDKMHKMQHATRLEKIILCRFTDILPFPKNKLFALFKGREIANPKHPGRTVWFHDLIENDGKPAPVQIDPEEDIAVLQYTGGTTGTPKGAMLTHANIVANAIQANLWFPDGRPGEEKMLGVLPFFHVFAMTAVMNMSVRYGFEIIATPRFELKETLRIIDKKKPHYFPAVPAIYNAINNSPLRKKYDLSSLRYCISGGAPLPVEVKKEFEAQTGCVVVEGYGLTESSPVVCVNPVHGDNRAGSIGLPVPGTIVEIIDTKNKKAPVKTGERGELCVRGPQVMKGYLNRPKDTDEVLRGGRLHTGDIAIMDEDGYVYIVDRIKDMIITNGYNVYPRNVEEAIYLHPSVEECVVAGLPDKNRGEIVKTWVKVRDGRTLSIEDLKEFLKDKLSPMEVPKLVEFRKEPLPKTMIGKLSRKDLLEEEKAKGDKS